MTTYPLALPAARGIARIDLRANNVVAVSRSPFTFAEQVVKHPGERWEASVQLPPMTRADAEQWVAFLLALRGQYGTFLLGDPVGASPRGTATAATVTGASGVSALTVAMSGTLLAGDYLQLGSGAAATLHKVLADQDGDGTLHVWPALRRAVTAEAAYLTDAACRFRLASNTTAWSISTAQHYGIAFDAVEAV